MESVKTSDKIYKFLVNLFKVLVILIIIVCAINYFLGKYIDKQKAQQANAKLPVIYERINKIIDANNDILEIKTHFEYKGTNFISVYVSDRWFATDDVQKKRYALEIRDNIKSILFEEGFIKPKDRLGIYVYTADGILLAESDMYEQIKLKD